MSKIKILESLKIIKNSVGQLNLDIKELENLEKEILNYEIKIPLIGNFNSGKSSLINTLISEDILPMEIIPKTAIATEIKYNHPDSYLEVYTNNKIKEIKEIDFLEKIDSNEYLYTVLKLNNQEIMSFKDITLVDMPGLDSGIVNHNKSILQYISSASSFLLIVDIQDGQIRESTLKFLSELKLYDLNFTVVLNKKDKILEENIQLIKQSIKETLKFKGMENVNVLVTDTIDSNGIYELKEHLKFLDRDKIFINIFLGKRNSIIESYLEQQLILYKNLDSSTAELDSEIENMEYGIESLKREVENQKIKLKTELKNKYQRSISVEIMEALNKNVSNLASDYLNNPNSFSNKLNECLRPVLVETVQEALNDLNITIQTNLNRNYDDIMEGVLKGEKVHNNAIVSLKAIQKNLEKISKFKNAHKTITTILAISTSVVAPWLEIIIIFLPDILKGLGFFGEKNNLEKIEKELKNKIFPDIIDKLQEPIESSVEEQGLCLIEEIEANYEKKIEANRKILEELKLKKEADISKVDKNKKLILKIKDELKNELEKKLIGDLK